MIRLAQIWRYPVKSIGRQRMARTRIGAGEKIPLDRNWAVLHEKSARHLNAEGELAEWLPKAAFLRGAAGPSLQGVDGGLQDGRLELSHPDQQDISVDLEDPADAARLIDWLRPLWPEDKPAPLKLVSGPEQLTDTRKPFVSINSLDSLSALEAQTGQRLGVERWRGNLWIEGAEPFAEQGWIGREIFIGPLRLIVRKPIGRCSAAAVDTDTGKPDRDMVRALTEAHGDANFGIYAEVLEGGEIAEMDVVTLGPPPQAEAAA